MTFYCITLKQKKMIIKEFKSADIHPEEPGAYLVITECNRFDIADFDGEEWDEPR